MPRGRALVVRAARGAVPGGRAGRAGRGTPAVDGPLGDGMWEGQAGGGAGVIPDQDGVLVTDGLHDVIAQSVCRLRKDHRDTPARGP